ncbi:hypothetical protein HDU77_009828 [Chytriomyces hyalinus]|nr:hypothetical protein HDU77_009828 [Chytriomyces hyalinus]
MPKRSASREPAGSPTLDSSAGSDRNQQKENQSPSRIISQRILETVFLFFEGTNRNSQQLLLSRSEESLSEIEEDLDHVDVDGDEIGLSSAAISNVDREILVDALGGLGLVDLAKIYQVPAVVTPKRKIWIILLGNHSAGKSSFINWYIDYPVQKTSVAIETTSFTLITSGKSRETFGGPATIQLFSALKGISEMKGVMPSLATEIVPSKHRNFDLITFIDTPGLVDGGVKYPFDPEKVLTRLVDEADLVFTFFDPIGQALCSRTMNVVESICQSQGHKIHFYLSKADTIPDESDRQRVLIQIAQSLTHRIQDRQFSLDIPPIYIPSAATDQVSVRNHMNGVLATIDSTIAQGVQKSLGALKRDCESISKAIRERLNADARTKRFNKRDIGRGFFLLVAALGPILMFVLVGLHRALKMVEKQNGAEALGIGGELLLNTLIILDTFVGNLTWSNIGYMVVASGIAFILWWFFIKKRKTLTAAELEVMREHLKAVSEVLPKRHEDLYAEYFEAHVSK